LEAAARLGGSDPRTRLVTTLYRIDPDICQALLRARATLSTASPQEQADAHPFADLLPAGEGAFGVEPQHDTERLT
jgi:hypothetical protein